MAGINFKAFDLGGHEIARRVWKDYYAKVRMRQRRTAWGRGRSGCPLACSLACKGLAVIMLFQSGLSRRQ